MLLFLRRPYLDALLAGRKTTTIRRGSSRVPAIGEVVTVMRGQTPHRFVCAALRPTTLTQLTDADAQRDGFATRADLHAALASCYRTLRDDEPLMIVALSPDQSARAVTASGYDAPT